MLHFYFKDNKNAVDTGLKNEIWDKDTTNEQTVPFQFAKFKARDIAVKISPAVDDLQ